MCTCYMHACIVIHTYCYTHTMHSIHDITTAQQDNVCIYMLHLIGCADNVGHLMSSSIGPLAPPASFPPVIHLVLSSSSSSGGKEAGAFFDIDARRAVHWDFVRRERIPKGRHRFILQVLQPTRTTERGRTTPALLTTTALHIINDQRPNACSTRIHSASERNECNADDYNRS